MKETIRLNEADITRMVMEAINELDWKTYANAAKKRYAQYHDRKEQDNNLFNKAYKLNQMANQRFNDEYVSDMKYDTFGDKLRGKHSQKFDGRFNVSKSDKMPYGAITGYNKSGNKIFSTNKGTYHSYNGITSPRNFFKDKYVADKFIKANDELWDYDKGNYEYEPNGRGWHLKDKMDESVKRVLNEEQLQGYDAPAYINCSSEEDADMKVEIGYSDYSSSLFYVGECGSDAGCALEAIVNYLTENGIIDCYTADTDLCDERDCVEINGYYIPSYMINIEQLCDNHGNSRKLREAVNRAIRKYLR